MVLVLVYFTLRMSGSFLLFVLFLLFCAVFSRADPPGFLSLLCGGSTVYTDSLNLTWIPDTAYVTTGYASTACSIGNESQARIPVRFFPTSDKHAPDCYKLPTENFSLILIRSKFSYNNYDGKEKPPAFFVSLGTANVTLINLTKNDPWVEEFIWKVKKDTVRFCLHSLANGGFPVISSLEMRPLPDRAYSSNLDGFGGSLLRKRFRINCGYGHKKSLRYPFDYYDRVWDPDKKFSPSLLTAGFKIQKSLDVASINERPPVSILQTARVLARKSVMTYKFPLREPGNYYLVLYFAGITPVSSTFDILINNNVASSGYTVQHGQASSLAFTMKMVDRVHVSFRNISFYPQVNAIEIYEIINMPAECSASTVSALKVIQQTTGIDFGWEDDPCSPMPWDHLRCEGTSVVALELSNMDLGAITPTFGDLPDLKSLDLHNSSLSGEITNLGTLQQLEILNLSFNKLTSFGSDFDTMINLHVLDLQNNSLEGAVPESLGSLKELHLLNLENNKLQGVLPRSLHKRSLDVRTSGNQCLSFFQRACKKNDFSNHTQFEVPQVVAVFPSEKANSHTNRIKILLGAAGSACFVVVFGLFVFVFFQRKKRRYQAASERWTARDIQGYTSAKVFTFKEIKTATNNFKDLVGQGGFGSVYLGKLSDGKLVAVKVRSDKTQLGADSFVNEVRILSQIRHQNLVALEGFFCESKQQILVYEYLPGGSLADNLYGSNSKKASLNWARRLKIAVDAAKGLDYLHNGSNPRIIHRDMKCSNILLDSEMNGKVGDFGLSKQVLSDSSHVSTVVEGTAGYLDPEYYATQQLTEKSDVYSFGVVLLELICGREPLKHSGAPDSFNLVLWAKPYLQASSFEIVDENLMGEFSVESMRRAASIAVRCVERDASQRPTMSQVLAELKEAYSIQLTNLSSTGHSF
ncbi:Leucine-rich repeat protein kinase family protein [Rhynchospora pubera]|uniref:Leucine-rich repeat protein kinase family protein n=1 Tax=Rhynchospora pubera TaxID=906938 RepID=A0AAV8CC90_9POAL|nr:Leucine-rich repeat protein kinase family protein [Rhynchospora pubera]